MSKRVAETSVARTAVGVSGDMKLIHSCGDEFSYQFSLTDSFLHMSRVSCPWQIAYLPMYANTSRVRSEYRRHSGPLSRKKPVVSLAVGIMEM